MAVTREMIKELIRKVNEAENNRPNTTVEETITAIDAICAPDSEFRSNRGSFHDRATERQGERFIFTMMPDYHRIIERAVIDPPFAAIEWSGSGTWDGTPLENRGCSILECNKDGLLKRGSAYVDMSIIPPPKGQ